MLADANGNAFGIWACAWDEGSYPDAEWAAMAGGGGLSGGLSLSTDGASDELSFHASVRNPRWTAEDPDDFDASSGDILDVVLGARTTARKGVRAFQS